MDKDINVENGAAKDPVLWRVSKAPVSYPTAVDTMETEVREIAAGAQERVWLLEHPPLYTAGTSAKPEDLLDPERFPVYKASRGGQYTYHGPGQRIAYVMLDLNRRRPDVRCFVNDLQDWLLATLKEFGIQGSTHKEHIGVWVERDGGEADKIAAIGVRIKKWVTFHGIALNVAPNLDHFRGVVPCGIDQAGLGVTSLAELGVQASMHDVDLALKRSFETVFGSTVPCKERE